MVPSEEASVTTILGTPGSFPLYRKATPVGSPQTYRKTATVLAAELAEPVRIVTPEGEMVASAGDFLAQHDDGHAWPIKREVFLSTYVPEDE
jgi:hypothetical protein